MAKMGIIFLQELQVCSTYLHFSIIPLGNLRARILFIEVLEMNKMQDLRNTQLKTISFIVL